MSESLEVPRDNSRRFGRAVLSSLLLVGGLLLVGLILDWRSSDLYWGGYTTCCFFYGVMFFLGLVAVRDNDGMLLARRSLPLNVALLTMTATWVGGGFINGSAEAAYTSGLAWTQAPWGYALSLIVGGMIFAVPMRRNRYTTMLDPLEDRFGTKVAALLYIPALLGEVFWTAAILTALGTTFGFMLDIDFNLSIIVSALIAIVYTSIGGLRSVAMTDVFQLTILVLGLYAAVPFLIPASGLEGLWHDYREVHGTSAYPWPSRSWGDEFYLWWDYALLLVFGGIPWHVYFQRVLASESERTAKWLSISAGGLCLVAAIPAVLIGMICATTDWAELDLAIPSNSALALPFVVKHLAPPLIGTIALGGVAAAVMSSVDSSILSASSMGAWNVYRPWTVAKPSTRNRPLPVDRVARRLIWIIGITATLLALQIQSVYALWFLCSDLVYCILFPQLLTALFDRRANAIGSVAGLSVALVLRLGGGEALLGLPTWIPYPMVDESGVINFPFRTTSMLAGFATIVVFSRFTARFSSPRPLKPRA